MAFTSAVRLALVWFALGAGGFVAIAHAGAESDFENRRDQERKNYDSMVSGMPVMDAHHLADLFHLAAENKEIALRTELSSTAGEGYVRVRVSGGNSSAIVRVIGGALPPAHSAVAPETFQFTLTDYSQPMQITTLSINLQNSINLQPNFCNISKSTQLPGNAIRSVSLSQQTNPASIAGRIIRLTINEVSRDGTSPPAIELQAPDFFTLLHAHPSECNTCLRPLLHDLEQDAIFEPNPSIAWQVFAESWKPDAAVSKQVDVLLPALDADDFRRRTQASHDLERLGRNAAAVLLHLDRAHLSAEQNARIDLALAPYTQLSPKEAARLHSDPTFLLDCLYSDDATLIDAALARLRVIADPTIQFDVSANPAARSAAIAALRLRLVRQ